MLELVAAVIGGYFVGSVPVGFLIVRKQAHVDIRAEGSGRSGGFNAFVVTGSKLTGVLVGVLDALKGFLAVFVASQLFAHSFQHQGFALLGAIAGHTYPIWTKFKGGRGLATAAGGMFMLGFSYTVVWGVVWLVTKIVMKRDILISNITAIILTPSLLCLIPWHFVQPLNIEKADNWTFLFFACVLSMLLLGAHPDVVSDVWKGPAKRNLQNSNSQT
ncbi:MAG TPA: glycerol-3-phosphate acyltransferase [Bacteroidota bacterium]|nr:glycerol-3-phosphate acyltransferase [Bacteroidota bacterium]